MASEHDDTRTTAKAPAAPAPANGDDSGLSPILGNAAASASAMDWSIFRDAEEDTLTWLWRTSLEASAAAATNVANAPGTSVPGSVAGAVGDPALVDLAQDEEDEDMDDQDQDDDNESLNYRMTNASVARSESGSESASIAGTGAKTRRVVKSKRPLQRSSSKTSPAGLSASASASENGDGDGDGDGIGEVDDEKKQMRRVKNLASVREFRKRKMRQQEENEDRLRRLEAENVDLKMRLKIGKEALLSERLEKQEIKEQMREMLQRGASEQEVAQFVNMYKVTYSDYGPKRREILHFHLSRIRELLLPTQVTKLCLYSVEQGRDMIASDKDDSVTAASAGMAPMSLWGILAQELNVSEAQQRQILERREAIKKVQEDLNHTLGIVKQLEQVTEDKNTALDQQIAELQRILTPSQASKFIIWVKENPAFMYMLDKIVDSTLMGTEHKDQDQAQE